MNAAKISSYIPLSAEHLMRPAPPRFFFFFCFFFFSKKFFLHFNIFLDYQSHTWKNMKNMFWLGKHCDWKDTNKSETTFVNAEPVSHKGIKVLLMKLY